MTQSNVSYLPQVSEKFGAGLAQHLEEGIALGVIEDNESLLEVAESVMKSIYVDSLQNGDIYREDDSTDSVNRTRF